jgi:hypothetical protein
MSLRKTANPVFTAPVEVPVPGQEAAEIVLRFKHKTRSQIDDFLVRSAKARSQAEDLDLLMEIVDGWEGAAVVDESGAALSFSRDALAWVIDQYAGATLAILKGYRGALLEARRKN